MSGRARATGLLLSLLVVGGCGTGPEEAGRAPDPSAPASPASPVADTPAAQALAALQDVVADLGAVGVRVRTSGDGGVGRRTGVADLRTGDFRATMTLSGGRSLEMIRRADLTWTRAPETYWVRLGYTAESAAATRGRWVVAPADGMKKVADALDPGAVVRSIAGLGAGSGPTVGPVRRGPLRGNRVLTFTEPGSVQRIFLTPGDRPRLLRVTSTRAGATTTVEVVELAGPVRLRLPAADDVVQPR